MFAQLERTRPASPHAVQFASSNIRASTTQCVNFSYVMRKYRVGCKYARDTKPRTQRTQGRHRSTKPREKKLIIATLSNSRVCPTETARCRTTYKKVNHLYGESFALAFAYLRIVAGFDERATRAHIRKNRETFVPVPSASASSAHTTRARKK